MMALATESKNWVEYDIHYAEQPVTTYDIDGFVALKRSTKVPIVADASARAVIEVYQMIKRGAADMFHCLLSRVGAFALHPNTRPC